jgi:hypothetical protein
LAANDLQGGVMDERTTLTDDEILSDEYRAETMDDDDADMDDTDADSDDTDSDADDTDA